jgi:hypothetical protein
VVSKASFMDQEINVQMRLFYGARRYFLSDENRGHDKYHFVSAVKTIF